jgi:hypothetical protein
MIDLTSEELIRLYEGSKDDRFIVAGSEVRQMIGMIRHGAFRIEALEAALRQIETTCMEAISYGHTDINRVLSAVARAALDKDASK